MLTYRVELVDVVPQKVAVVRGHVTDASPDVVSLPCRHTRAAVYARHTRPSSSALRECARIKGGCTPVSAAGSCDEAGCLVD